jgi:GDP-L-fucose synthase
MNKISRIYIAGHNGMVGSAIRRLLERRGYDNLLLTSSKELDLRDQRAVNEFFSKEKPDYVFLAAAKVGGINANSIYRADFIYDNLAIELNVIHAAWKTGVKKLLFLGSSCIYPKVTPQPMKEDYLLSGYLEETNEPYAIAKIAGLKLCESFKVQYGCNFISAMPTNLYGPNDNYDLENSHVLPALIRKFHEATIRHENTVTVWGSGNPKREFLHVDDLAEACYLLMHEYDEKGFLNIGYGDDITIAELAELVKEITGFKGEIVFDKSKPDGTVRKLIDSSKIQRLGWKPKINLKDGIRETYALYRREILHV